MVYDKSVGAFLQVGNLLLEVLVAFEIDFVELVLVYEIFSYFFEVFVCCAVVFVRIGEEKGAFFERKSAYLSYFICSFY